jgi:hypothetical protein
MALSHASENAHYQRGRDHDDSSHIYVASRQVRLWRLFFCRKEYSQLVLLERHLGVKRFASL